LTFGFIFGCANLDRAGRAQVRLRAFRRLLDVGAVPSTSISSSAPTSSGQSTCVAATIASIAS
jgi:hypothetical protein